MKPEETFYIGYISKTRGLKGEVQLYFEFEDYLDIDFDVIFISLDGKLVPFFVSEYKLHENKTGYFFFDDFDHIDKIKPLIKKEVYLPLNQKPQRDEDDFYYTDLKGYTAVDKNLGELGEITNVFEYPQQFVASVIYKDVEILFPLNEDFIIEIDDASKILHLDLPEGLLDVYLQNDQQ